MYEDRQHNELLLSELPDRAMAPNVDTMNETDVREFIVRPLLNRLG
jgi:hypothetical protein